MAYPQGNASQNIDQGIYDSTFNPDNTVAGIIDNHTPVNKLGLRNSIGKELSLLQNYVCQQYLGRYSLPINSGFINNLRGQLNSTIHLGSDIGEAGIKTYSIPGTTEYSWSNSNVSSGTIVAYNFIKTYNYDDIYKKYYNTWIHDSKIHFGNWDSSGVITVWPNASGYIGVRHGGNTYGGRPNLDIYSNGHIRLDTEDGAGTIYVSGNMEFCSAYKSITMNSPDNLTAIDEYSIGNWNHANGKSVQMYDANIQFNGISRIHGFDNLSIDSTGPILIDSTRSTWTRSNITLSGEFIDILSPNINLQGTTTISGRLESSIFTSTNGDFVTTLSPNLLTFASGGYTGLEISCGDGASIENNIFGYASTLISSTTTLTLKSLSDDIRLFSIPTFDPGVPGQIYRTGGALMISI